MLFKPATREKIRLRMAIDGPSGSGKTFTALRFANALGKKIAVINTESGAVQKYEGLNPDGIPFHFDVCDLDDFAPSKFTEAILAAGKAGYEVVIIDSLSHAWAGSGGALELKDRQGGNSFTAWKTITPLHNQMIEAILRSPCHVIATMRSKTEYVLEANDRGQSIPRKVGMAPVQRAGMEYEFDLYCSIDSEHIMRVSKSRCPEVTDAISVKPGMSFMTPVVSWLNDGSAASPDKFAVTESDLRRLAKAESADKPPAPRKTPQELMAEAAAKVEATRENATVNSVAASPVVTTLADAPAVPFLNGETKQPSELASVESVAKIELLCSQLGINDDGKKSICQKRGVFAFNQLSQEQAATIITNLAVMAANAVASGGVSELGVAVGNDNDPCTDQQVSEIKAALAEWEQSQPGVVADFIARLNGAGFGVIADMTFKQASELKSAIQAKTISNFFASMLETAAAG